MNTQHGLIDSPLGPLTAVTTAQGLSGLYLPDHRGHPPLPTTSRPAGSGILSEAAAQLTAYFDGALTEFDLPLAVEGTAFQQRVWAALRRIPYGATQTYGELAAELGAPSASRAVGLANGRNPVSIVVPCHRVVGSTGRLVGYAGGLPAKQWLLDHERRAAAGGRRSAAVGALA